MHVSVRQTTGFVSPRLVANVVAWLISFQSAWGIVKLVPLTGYVNVPELVKFLSFTLFFGLVGALITWRFPPYDARAGFRTNARWLLPAVVTFGLWIEVVEQVWTISSALWVGNPVEPTVVVYTIVTALLAVWFNLKWMPRDFGVVSR